MLVMKGRLQTIPRYERTFIDAKICGKEKFMTFSVLLRTIVEKKYLFNDNPEIVFPGEHITTAKISLLDHCHPWTISPIHRQHYWYEMRKMQDLQTPRPLNEDMSGTWALLRYQSFLHRLFVNNVLSRDTQNYPEEVWSFGLICLDNLLKQEQFSVMLRLSTAHLLLTDDYLRCTHIIH